jgi:hypothetical protein
LSSKRKSEQFRLAPVPGVAVGDRGLPELVAIELEREGLETDGCREGRCDLLSIGMSSASMQSI